MIEQSRELARRFREAESPVGLAAVLRSALLEQDPEADVEWIRPRVLSLLAFHGTRRYRSFTVPKKSGGVRELRAPTPKLKSIQRALNACFNATFEPHRCAYGFVPGRSVADNARCHVGRRSLLNLDLKDFFPSTSFRRVKTVLGLEPFAFVEEREELGFLIANLCCDGGVLPQGAPTSPTLTNVVCQRLDRRLNRLARQQKLVYTRYADDLTFSSKWGEVTAQFEAEARGVIVDEGYSVNEKKTRRRSSFERQEVTGLTVNEKVNVPRQFIKDLRYRLHVWERFGLVKAQADFVNKRGVHYDRVGSSSNGAPKLEHVVAGQLSYLSMVRGCGDPVVRRFASQYERVSTGGGQQTLHGGKPAIAPQRREAEAVVRILGIWDTDGLTAAVDEALSSTETTDQSSRDTRVVGGDRETDRKD